jgi:plastocyanin
MRPNSWFNLLLSKSLPMAVLLACAAASGSIPALAAAPTGSRLTPPDALGTLPADWVAGGDGLVLFGAGTSVHVAPMETPGAPVASLELRAPVEGAAVVGRYAYLAQSGLGLRVLDLGVPDQPADLGLIPFQGAAFRVTQWSDYLLVASDSSLTVLSLGTRHSHVMDGAGGHCMAMVDPFALGEVASMRFDGLPLALSASGTKAFLATRDGRLLAIDLSDRTNPTVLSVRDLPAGATALSAHLDGMALGFDGARVAALPEGRSLDGPVVSGARGLASMGRKILIAGGQKGLYSSVDESAQAATVNVNVANFFFSPSTVTINQGDTIHWIWVGGTHSSTSGGCPGGNCTPDGLWNSTGKTSGTFDHTFPDAGTFSYFCEVHLASMTGKVTVKSTGPAPLSASSSASVTTGQAPLAVTFTGTAAGGTPPYTYSWDLGDGGSSTDQNPSHTYSQVGGYNVVLTVHDSASGTAQATPISIHVDPVGANPPVISAIKKVSPPFTLVVTGSNLQNGVQVTIGSTPWSNVLWKSVGKLKITGGTSLKTAIPKGVATQITFLNPDGGTATATFSW